MMDVDPAQEVRKATAESELINTLREADEYLAEALPLTDGQVGILEAGGNRCGDWSRVKATPEFVPEAVVGSTFIGDVTLGTRGDPVEIAPGVTLPSGVAHSVVANSKLGPRALVKGVGLLANYVVKGSAVIADCGEVSCGPGCTFGTGRELPIAIETGGREVMTYAELSVPVAARVARSRADRDMLDEYAAAVADYVKAVASDFGVIESRSRVSDTPVIKNAFIGLGARVSGATRLENVAILSNYEEVTEISAGACVIDSVVQWGCEVTTMAIVSNSVLTEHSHVERHGKVSDSVVGPNTGVGEGEVGASLLGPFVGFHHQAMLIAAYWPEGKGNIAYGSNVGSNHPSRAPDQEIWPGEGAFIGLGCSIKFPTDFSEAPYILVASGVTTLAQKVTFPFALMNSPRETYPGISPAFNEIFPGWVLSDNIFMIRRNEGKYKKRNKARRTEFVFDIFRPDTVDKMISSRAGLQSVGGKELYVREDLPGLGKNFMSEASRVKGIETYTFYIRYYALLGLKRVLSEGADAASVLTAESADERWEHERRILAEEFPGEAPKALLDKLVEMQREIARGVELTKHKDDVRGIRVIPDYADAHPSAEDDPFVRQSWEETEALAAECAALTAKM